MNNVTCTNCKATYSGERLKQSLNINEPTELRCSCGKYIKVTNYVTMTWEMKYTSAYDKNEGTESLQKDLTKKSDLDHDVDVMLTFISEKERTEAQIASVVSTVMKTHGKAQLINNLNERNKSPFIHWLMDIIRSL